MKDEGRDNHTHSCVILTFAVHIKKIFGHKRIYSWKMKVQVCPCSMSGWRGNVFISCVSSLPSTFLSPLTLSFISSTISSISLLPFSGRWHKMTHSSPLLSLLPFSGRWHKMTHKGWRVFKPQRYQRRSKSYCTALCDPSILFLWRVFGTVESTSE